MAVIAAVVSALSPAASYHSSIRPLTNAQKTMLKRGGFWHRGCPVGLGDLRVLTVTYRGFDKHNHSGQLVTNKNAASKLAAVFRQLYRIHFPIHNLSIAKTYGTGGKRSAEPDPTGS